MPNRAPRFVPQTRGPGHIRGFDAQRNKLATLARANTFEGGNDGTTVTTANSGDTSGDAFQLVSASVTYSTAQARGGLSAGILSAGAAAQTFQWLGLALGTGQPLYIRAYLWVDANPATNAFAFTVNDQANTALARLRVSTAGVLQWQDSGANVYAGLTSTATIATGAWNRIEARIDPRGSIEYWLFKGANLENPVGGTADEHLSATGLTFTGTAQIDQARFGVTAAAATGWQQYWDDVAILTDSWLGPTATTVVPPADVTVTSVTATGTGAAGAPTLDETLIGATATGTGSSAAQTLVAAILPATATGTGSAPAPVAAQPIAIPAAATGTGTAGTPTLLETVLAPAAAGTGSATPPASLNLTAVTATGTGAAGTPTLTATLLPSVAAGTGLAGSPALTATITGSTATGSGQAYGPASLNLSTATATGTGTAPTATLTATLTSITAAGSGEAGSPTLTATLPSATAVGTGTAAATLTTTETPATATGTGTAAAPTLTASILPTTATGTGSADAPTLFTFNGVSAPTATGTGTAGAPTLDVVLAVSTATGTGSAEAPAVYQPAILLVDNTATGTGQAYYPAGFVFEGVGTGEPVPTPGSGGGGAFIQYHATAPNLGKVIEPTTAQGRGGALIPQIINPSGPVQEPPPPVQVPADPIIITEPGETEYETLTRRQTVERVITQIREGKHFVVPTAIGYGGAIPPKLVLPELAPTLAESEPDPELLFELLGL